MPPVNDDFADATELSGTTGFMAFSNVGATFEAGEPDNANRHSVWFKFTANGSGTAIIDTTATPLPEWDSMLSVYQGSALSSLALVAQDDDGGLQAGATNPNGFGTSRVQFEAVGGVTYYIQVTAWDDITPPERDDAVLTWSLPDPIAHRESRAYPTYGRS